VIRQDGLNHLSRTSIIRLSVLPFHPESGLLEHPRRLPFGYPDYAGAFIPMMQVHNHVCLTFLPTLSRYGSRHEDRQKPKIFHRPVLLLIR